MRLNTRSLSALEAGIDSSCNDLVIIYFVVSLDIDVCTIYMSIGELATLEFTSCLNTKLKIIIGVSVCKIVISHIFRFFAYWC